MQVLFDMCSIMWCQHVLTVFDVSILHLEAWAAGDESAVTAEDRRKGYQRLHNALQDIRHYHVCSVFLLEHVFDMYACCISQILTQGS